tara:strand:- start:223 stop:1056 length:834 start_codon:yes stop_codon:yes gene_type:complete
MKKVLFIIGLFISFLSNAQSIDELEHKNGFKSLKLNTHISNLKYNLSLIEFKDGYSTYKYVEGFDFSHKLITIKKRIPYIQIAQLYPAPIGAPGLGNSWEYIKIINPNIKLKRSYIEKNQEIYVPVIKKLSEYPLDKSLFNLFEYPINSIKLTFDNSTNTLKYISLNLDEELSIGYLDLLGFRLKKLYNNFSEIIGPTTESNKPNPDCEKFKNKSCLFFEEKSLDGEILWKSTNVVLSITQKANVKSGRDGMGKLIVNKVVSFQDRTYYKSIKNSGF